MAKKCCCDYRWEWTHPGSIPDTVLAICHDRDDFGEGTGNISRLNPSGGVIWTYDLPDQAGTGFEKKMTRCAIDSAGNIYATWYLRNQFGTGGPGDGFYATSQTDPSAGVAKLNKDGEFQWEIEFGETASFYGPNYYDLGNFIKVDPNDDDRIYVTTKVETDGTWIYQIDADGNVTATYQLNASGTDNIQGGAGCLTIDADGNIYSVNTLASGFSNRPIKFSPSGTQMIRFANRPIPVCPSIVDPAGGIVFGSGESVNAHTDRIMMKVSDADAAVWSARFNNYGTALGWSLGGGFVAAIGQTPTGFLAALTSHPTHNDGSQTLPYNLFAVLSNGTAHYKNDVNIPEVFDLACAPDNSAAYVVGSVSETGATTLGQGNVARIEAENGNTSWLHFYGTNTGLTTREIRGVAYREVA